MDFINKEEVCSRMLQNIQPDSTAETLEKSMNHKYFKREGTPGNYKYFYTEADYKAGKSSSSEPTSNGKKILRQSKPFPSGRHDYRLVLKEEDGKRILYVERDFERRGEWDGVPSGWNVDSEYWKNPTEQTTLTIDGGQNWKVFVPPSVLKEIFEPDPFSEVSSHISQIDSSIESTKTKSEEKINQIKDYTKNYTEKLVQLKSLIPSIESAISSYGAKISSLSYHKTGRDSGWESGDGLGVSMSITPTEKSKIKFIKDEGFTREGRGKNDSKLEAQAEKLKDYLKEALSLDYVGVNKYSFEEKHGLQGNILVDFYLR